MLNKVLNLLVVVLSLAILAIPQPALAGGGTVSLTGVLPSDSQYVGTYVANRCNRGVYWREWGNGLHPKSDSGDLR